jgi:Flp pilus assembly protein TadD
MIRRYVSQQESLRERARVAAELVEEARLLTETAMLAPDTLPNPQPERPASERTVRALGNGDGGGNGSGHGNNGHGNGNGNGRSQRKPVADDLATTPRSAAERALAALDHAMTGAPDDVDLLLHRASQLGAMGQYAAARVDLEHALMLDPGNVTVRNALGIVLLRKGLWAQAVPHLQQVVEVESWSPTAWFYLGEALNHVDDLDGALAAFGRAAELDPLHAKALYGQGVVLDRLRRPVEAARLYRRSREVAAR